MKQQKHYFSLRCKGDNSYHRDKELLKFTDRIVNIGETPDCDVRFESGSFQPEYYASIVRNDDGKSWRIVKRSQHTNICIDGRGDTGYAMNLKDGDLIRIEGQTAVLCFHTHYNDRYDQDENRSQYWQWGVVGLIAMLALILAVANTGRQKDNIGTKDVESLEESIFLVRVDSVCRVRVTDGQEEMLPPMKVLNDEAPTGTAFLTTDGRMITARHCVEYWIGTNLELTTKVASLKEDDIIRWAIETETYNQEQRAGSRMLLRTYFSLYDFMGNRHYAFASTDKQVHMNTENDGIFLLADFAHEYYWRSIRPYFTERKMELGDILWIDSLEERGKVELAEAEDMEKVKSGTTLMVCGYPMTGLSDKRMTATEGTVRRTTTAQENLVFESNINHGFSGGPVLTKIENKVVAIGVVSRVDSVSSGLYKWAVPITEVK